MPTLRTKIKEPELDLLSYPCIKNGNYEILSFLMNEGMKIKQKIVNEAVFDGNLYLVKHFLHDNQMPDNILIDASESGNFELVKYILEKTGFYVTSKGTYLNLFNIYFIVLIFIIIFDIYLIHLKLQL